MAVIGRPQEKRSSVSALQGSPGSGSYPRVNERKRPTRCTRYCGTDTFTVISSRIDVYKFSFLPRTVTDWNALPPSTRAKQTTDTFKKALYTHTQTILLIVIELCHSCSNGWPPIVGYSLKNWRTWKGGELRSTVVLLRTEARTLEIAISLPVGMKHPPACSLGSKCSREGFTVALTMLVANYSRSTSAPRLWSAICQHHTTGRLDQEG